ncbi:PIG-X-domain-containing protein [Ophiobolus disseminans]|uniref:Protein PBN1 n=1 Tax=Ophiobolus disseminans TaxID=1469910 RepID=A0A6A6ZSD2_9PLEO|nr:PIG-X-domain-containing protein [Ophiobolus disseminans]
MKQRITYVVKDPDSFTPEQLGVQKHDVQGSFSVTGVEAAKELRITLGLDELPSELSAAFQTWHELHVRWVSPEPYVSTPPFTSRVSPGLHVLFTPRKSTPEHALCDQLHRFVDSGLKCTSINETSIKLPVISERFSMSASAQYYTFRPSIRDIALRLSDQICGGYDDACEILITELASASYIDIDYDTITRAVVINAGWPSGRGGGAWTETVYRYRNKGTVEIGVLTHEPNPDPEDIQFGGFLTVLGQDSSPKPTRFQTPARHYPLLSPSSSSPTPQPHPLTYTTSFQHPTGLHPTLLLTFPSRHLTPPNPSCKLHTHLTLPSYLFIDKYQFTDPLFLSSKNIKSLRSLSGATDLEAPDWVIKEWGSAALFELANTQTQSPSAQLNVSIPLHLRYLPASNTSHTRVPVPWPVVFWACRADEGAKMAANPFDRVHLGYEALFGLKTRFMHVEPKTSGGELVEWIDVPVLDLNKTGWVEWGTLGTVVLAFAGLCWVLFGRGWKRVESGKKTQ